VSWETPIACVRAARLLVRLRFTRFLNQAASGLQRFSRTTSSRQRKATAGKAKLGSFVGSLVAIAMLYSFTSLASQAFSHLRARLAWTPAASAAAAPVQSWLGAQVSTLTEAEAQALGWAFPRGAKVVASAAGTPARDAGLLKGDVLLALDGQEIADPAHLIGLVRAKPPGSLAELRVLRGQEELRLRAILSGPPAPLPATARRVPLQAAPGRALPRGLLQGCALETSILLVAALLMSLASREFAMPDWDLEWLVTLPVSLATLLGVRIVERTLLNPGGLLALWPFLSVVAWGCGHRLAAPLLGLTLALVLLLFIAVLWTLLDTTLRLKVSAPKLRNLQAMVSIAAVGCLYLAMSAGLSAKSYVVAWAPNLPASFAWLPPALAVEVLAGTSPAAASGSLLLLILEGAVFASLGFAILNRQLRFGVVGMAGRESGGRGLERRNAIGSLRAGRRLLMSPIQAREVRLLARDRNFLVQTLILPVMIMGTQVLFNAPGSGFALHLGLPQHVAAAAFGIAAYALMFSALQTLNAEGQALWILYSVPRPIEQILREKALLWGTVCLTYAVAVWGLGLAFGPPPSLFSVELMVLVLIGVPIFAIIGTALGVFACDPLAQQVQRRVRPSYVYLYMLLASLYVYAIYASSLWQRMGLVVLTALLGLALWQKARDYLPYLLDPDASPPARVSVADGLIAALLFFVLQGLCAVLLTYGGQRLSGRVVLVSFSLAGAVTYGCMRFVFWRLKTQGVPRAIGPHPGRSAVRGVVGGLCAAVAAIAYLKIASHTSLFHDARASMFTGRDGVLLMVLLAVGAAPIFEEFIFRGLIFGGLRRSLGLAAAVLLSAGIFALVHPAPSVIPVFGLGVAAALVYEGTGLLLGPMVVHAVYNAAVLAYQLL
jgi:membrane protease YdiL (CAAX protease family)